MIDNVDRHEDADFVYHVGEDKLSVKEYQNLFEDKEMKKENKKKKEDNKRRKEEESL
ncbi:MAG: hypothetical protein ACLRWM_11560 [Streptococcus sp.]